KNTFFIFILFIKITEHYLLVGGFWLSRHYATKGKRRKAKEILVLLHQPLGNNYRISKSQLLKLN
ncbi:MAG: hypothetical protein IKJ67_00760, partial [Bacteroidales bacterium]|nr:hypothetical protein [Bacteroidales bacterium]